LISPGAKRYQLPNESPAGEFAAASAPEIIVALVGDGKRVLEVGCADELICRHLTARGNRVTVVDSDALAGAPADSHERREEMLVADLNVRSLADVLQERRFDVAVFGGILEHLRDPVRVLREARSFLSDDGFAIVSIPNAAHGNVRLSVLRGEFDDDALGLLHHAHLRRFTLRSIRELCVRAGYRIDAVERTKVPLFVESRLVPHVDEGDFSPDVVAEIRRDGEHDTLQFVLRASPVRESDHLALALEELTSAERRLADASAKLARLDRHNADSDPGEDGSAELRALLAERDAALAREAALAEAEAGLAARLAEVEARAQTRERELVQIAEERASALARLAQELSAALADARAVADEAEETLSEARRKEEAAAAAVRAAQAERDELAERLALAEAAPSGPSADELLSMELAFQERDALAARLAELEESSQAQHEALTARLAELEEGALAREAAIAEAAVLREAVNAHELELVELQQRLETERAEFAQQQAQADESIAELRASFSAAATELLDVQHETELEREALARQQQVAAETLEALRLSSAERDALAERIVEAETALAKLEQTIAERELELIGTVRELEAERDALAARLAEAEASVENLWETIAERERELMDELRELAEERDTLTAWLSESEASVAALWETIAERERELLGDRFALAAECDALMARLAEAQDVALAREAAASESMAKRLEKEAGLVATVANLEAELGRVRSAHRAAVELFKRHVDTDVKLARAESTEIDGKIHAIQRSWPWSLKMLLVRARHRLPGGRARV